MILKRLYEEQLAQAGYLVGCAATGEAAVIDANRDVDAYLAAAAAEGLRITAVAETHIHADYVSGSRELARRTGAALYLSDEGDADWKYAFAESDGATLVRDGDSFRVGRVRFNVLHTPGHTPEHITFVVIDEAASPEPLGAFTGDFLFVGDVGRPDLLERAASVAGTMEPGARALFASLKRFRALPGHLLIWPAHGAGSACGKSLGGVPVTSLGYEERANWAFAITDEDRFVEAVLAGQPEPPRYFAEMKRVNKEGPALLGGFRVPPRLAGGQAADLLRRGALVADIRSAADFAAAHLPGTLNLPGGRAFANWAGWLLPYGEPLYLLADGEEQAEEAARRLALIGLDRVEGWLGAEAVRAFAAAGGQTRAIGRVAPDELAALLADGGATVVDVRGRNEWDEAHIPGARHIPLGYLAQRAAELPTDRPVVVHCQGGTRSAIAASVLSRLGFPRVLNLAGGFAAYRRGGYPVETNNPAAAGVEP